MDSWPIAACDTMRMPRATRYAEAQFRGDLPSKKRYVYGLKVPRMVTKAGQPVEFFLTQGGCGDVDALTYYPVDLPEGSMIYADRA